jgi:hypothetical protein
MNDRTEPGDRLRRSRHVRLIGLLPLAALLLVMGGACETAPSAVAAAGKLPAPPASGEMGFVVVKFHTAFHNGGNETDCPDGMMGVLKDSYLRTLPKAEVARLSKPENANELDKKWKEYGLGPDNTNICGNVYEFMDRPPTPMMKGKVAWGLNLDDDTGDGSTNPYTCKHQNFTSPAGEKGIDYQIWRVQGCSAVHRGVNNDGLGDFRFGFDDSMMSGERTQVILLRGVDSLENDDDVEVVYANTDDRPIADGNGNPIHGATFTVATSGRKMEYRNVLKGRIADGVLNTYPKDIDLNGPGLFDLDRGRVRLEFQLDGTVRGVVGGYEPLLGILRQARGGSRGSVQTAGIDCAGQFAALRMMADGDRDPRTGQCRRISFAYELVAVPAFINDVEPKSNIAAK